jgi:putative SOS response-associated peptidase YedK
MCGRYRLSRRRQFIAEHFDSLPGDDDWEPRYNIAPTQPVPIIRQHPKERSRVSNVANDDAECCAPVAIAQEQARLF